MPHNPDEMKIADTDREGERERLTRNSIFGSDQTEYSIIFLCYLKTQRTHL